MLIVTGASGRLGRKIVETLLLTMPATRIGLSVREPSKVADLEALGVRVRRGDFEDAESLRHAWEGAERVLLVSSNAAATGGDTLGQHATAVGVARGLDVARVLYTSQVSSSPTSLFPPGRHHAATEDMLARSGLAWTAMRHGFYAASAVMMNQRGLDAGLLATPEDGKVAWTTHDDLAAADAALLAGTEVIDGPTPPLTGREALDLADLAKLASEITGRPIERTVLDEADMETRARQAGAPVGAIGLMLGYYRAAKAGEFAVVDPTLTRILGREPETMRTVLTACLPSSQVGGSPGQAPEPERMLDGVHPRCPWKDLDRMDRPDTFASATGDPHRGPQPSNPERLTMNHSLAPVWRDWLALWNGDLSLAAKIVAPGYRLHMEPIGGGGLEGFAGPEACRPGWAASTPPSAPSPSRCRCRRCTVTT